MINKNVMIKKTAAKRETAIIRKTAVNKKRGSNLLKTRVPVLMLIIPLMLSLVITTGGTVFATSTTSGAEITGYTITLQNGQPASRVTKGMIVNITLTVADSRFTGLTYTPPVSARATLNTASFTGANAPAAVVAITNTGTVADPIMTGTYTLIFNNLTYTGVPDSFACNVSYTDSTNATLPLAMQNLSVTLNQLVQYVPPPDPPDPPPPDPPPDPPPTIETNFVMRSASYGDDTVYAGVPFNLTVVILATNGTNAVDNVTVSFSPPEQMTIQEGSSVSYIGRMGPGSTATVSTSLMPNGNIPEGSYIINIIVEGFNNGNRVSAPMTVSVPVLQPERFDIFNTMLPTFLTAGMDDGMGFGTITLVNKGQGAVANVTVDVRGDGLYFSEGRQFIGNIAGGAQSNADFVLMADIPGRIEGEIVVYYENIRGEQKELQYYFTVDVAEFMPPEIVDPGLPWPEEPPGTGGIPTWLWILIIAGAAAGVTIVLIRRNKKKKAAAEAALDADDFDDD